MRTLAKLPLSIDLVEHGPVPAYQRIGEEALQLRRLGWTYRKIARRFGVTDKTVQKAIALEAEFEPEGVSAALRASVMPTKYRGISARALELHEGGSSLEEIAAELGVSAPTAKRAVRYALGGGVPERGENLPQRLAKDALRLREEGWTLKQVAEELGVSVETARKAVEWGRTVRGRRG